MAKQDDYVRYTVRVPKEAYSELEKAAASANRSVNAEIVARLEASLGPEGASSPLNAILTDTVRQIAPSVGGVETGKLQVELNRLSKEYLRVRAEEARRVQKFMLFAIGVIAKIKGPTDASDASSED